MPLHVQPSLPFEYVFAVVRTHNNGAGDYFRPECELCWWVGRPTPFSDIAEADTQDHDAERHVD